MKAYIVFHGNGNDYEDYCEIIDRSFFDKQIADSYVSAQNDELEKDDDSLIAKHAECEKCLELMPFKSVGKDCYRPNKSGRCLDYHAAPNHENEKYWRVEIEIE